MATLTTPTSSKPAFFSLLRSTEAPMAEDPMPASQANTILRMGSTRSVRAWASSCSSWVRTLEIELSLPLSPSIWAVAAARSPSSSRRRLARRMIDPMMNDVVAANSTDKAVARGLGVHRDDRPGRGRGPQPGPEHDQGEDADHAPGDRGQQGERLQ